MTTKQPPAFQFYARDWLSGKRNRMLRPAERGAHADLLAVNWIDGEIPTDEEELADLLRGLGYNPDELRLARILDLFPGGKSERLEKERKKQAEYRRKKAEAGRKGAAAKWEKERQGDDTANGSASPSDGSAMSVPMANGMANDGPAVCSLQSATTSSTTTTTSARELDEKTIETVGRDLPNCADEVLRVLAEMPRDRHRSFIASLSVALEGLPPVKDAAGKTVLGAELEQMIVVAVNALGPELARSSRPADRLIANLRGVAARWNESPRQRRGPKPAENGNGVPKGWTQEEWDALAS